MSEETTIVTLPADETVAAPVVQREVLVTPAEQAVVVETPQQSVVAVEEQQSVVNEVVELQVVTIGEHGPKGDTGATGATGTFSAIAAGLIVANLTGAPAIPDGYSLSDIFDGLAGSTQGQMYYRNATGWNVLNPGTAGQALITGGSAADPSWGKLAVGQIDGLGTNVATLLGAFSSANLAAALTDKTGTLLNVFSDAPTFTTSVSVNNVSGNIKLLPGVYPALQAQNGSSTITSQWVNDISAGSSLFDITSSLGGFFRIRNAPNSGSTLFNISSTGALTVNSSASAAAIINNSTAGSFVEFSVASNDRTLTFGERSSTHASGKLAYIHTTAGDTPLAINFSGGSVLINGVASRTLGNANQLQVQGTTSATNSLGISAWSADALGARIELGKSRGAAIGTNTIVQSGDVVGSITGYGANGSTFTNAAQISMEIDGTPGATNDMPGRIVFKTTPDGSGTLTEAARFDSAQNTILIGSIKTGAPTTGTAAAWKLGSHQTAIGLSMLTTDYIELDVGGTLYKLALAA